MKKPVAASVLCGAITICAYTGVADALENYSPTPIAKPTITAEQRARLAQKLQRIEQIMQAASVDPATHGLPAESRRWLLESLLKLTPEQLAQVPAATSFRVTANALKQASKATPKMLGDPNKDLVYRPITPCRFIDTRFIGGPIVGSRDYTLSGDGGPNGGSASCNPVANSGVTNADDIAAVSMNVAIIGPTVAPGFIGVRPPGSANTTALVNWYQAGPQVQASNAGVVSTLQSVGNPNEIEFFGSPTDIVVDIMGVFTRPDATPLDCTQVINAVVVANGARQTHTTTCAAGYQAVGGGVEVIAPPLATNDNSFINALAPSFQDIAGTNAWFASVTNNSGQSQTYNFYAICCRVPGR